MTWRPVDRYYERRIPPAEIGWMRKAMWIAIGLGIMAVLALFSNCGAL